MVASLTNHLLSNVLILTSYVSAVPDGLLSLCSNVIAHGDALDEVGELFL